QKVSLGFVHTPKAFVTGDAFPGNPEKDEDAVLLKIRAPKGSKALPLGMKGKFPAGFNQATAWREDLKTGERMQVETNPGGPKTMLRRAAQELAKERPAYQRRKKREEDLSKGYEA